MDGRIMFAGSPWPKGHMLERFTLAGRLDEEGLWLEIALQSVPYDAEDPGARTEEPNWGSPSVWRNHGAVRIETGDSVPGALVGSDERPLSLRADGSWVVEVDGEPTGEIEDNAFQIYLLGHDAIAHNELVVTPRGSAVDVSWRARIALAYSGEYGYEHAMVANIENAPFAGFLVDESLEMEDAAELWPSFVADASRFVLKGRTLRLR